ncbi:MAG TPA: LysR family transcriptional regulator [Casimicrobium sp.]|nr:LysR family transcriptional regulator [Casimicrobium sp.]
MARINFDLQQLQAFLAVAERNSFRAAAEAIHLSPPALSRRIDKLETILGVKLFNRTTREVELTSLGRVFLERARTALDDLEAAMLGISEVSATRSGSVSVACVPSAALYFLPTVIRSFTDQYPKIRIRVIDEAADVVRSSVASGEADFGIAFMSAQMPGIDFEPIHDDPFVLAVCSDNAFARRKSVRWRELGAERLISVARSSGNRQLLDDALSKAGFDPKFALEVNHVATLLGMVEAGLGVAVVPRMALPKSHTSLVGIALSEPYVSRRLGLILRHNTALRPAADIFYSHLRAAFNQRSGTSVRKRTSSP